MTVENEAFIDIEMALHDRVEKDWFKAWHKLQKKLNRLANAGEWDAAFKATNEIDFTPIVEKHRKLARTLAEASLFLGASRIDDPTKASFFGAPDERLIDVATEQWETVMVKNANQALRLQAQVLLGDMEREQSAADIIKAPKNPLTKVGTQGAQYSGIAASLMISRASTAGFFIEAQARGIKVYKVSEVMDSATCPICRTMHNKEFPVAAGVAMSTSIMNATDPDSLRQIAPWPSQSAANVKKIGLMNQGALIGAGLNLPPYHPWCRGIATIITKGGVSGAGVAVLASRALAGSDDPLVGTEGLSSEELGRRLFGETDALDAAAFENLFGVGSFGFIEGVEAGIVDETNN